MKHLFSIFAVVIILLVMGVPLAMAQDATEEAPAGDVVVVPVESPAPVSEGNSDVWYLTALGVIVFVATFAQYNLERMSGKSMRELSNSVPTHLVQTLLNGGSYLAKLTTTDADDKSLIQVGVKMGYVARQFPNGAILWDVPSSTASVTPVESVPPVGEPIVNG
jgi:hypothetical protein